MTNSLIEAVVGALFGVVIILTSVLTSADLAVIVLGALLTVACLIYIFMTVKKLQSAECTCCKEAAVKSAKKPTTKKTTTTKKTSAKKTEKK